MEMGEPSVRYSDQSVGQFKRALVVKEFNEAIKAVCFSDEGQYLGLCSNNYIWIYDVLTAKKVKKLPFKNQKLDHMKFSHNNQAILVASQTEHKVYYWSIHENEIVKVFTSHSAEIQSLSLNPRNDQFITSSADGFVRVWDLGQKHCGRSEGELDLSGKKISSVVAEFDQSGCIFCVGYCLSKEGTQYVYFRLYDAKRYQDGAFKVWTIESNEVRVLRFSPDGQFLAAATLDGQVYLFDSFDGRLKNKFVNHSNDSNLVLQMSFSPCSKYLLSGCEDGCLHVYGLQGELGNEAAALLAHRNKVHHVLFNPIYALIVSVSTHLILWQIA